MEKGKDYVVLKSVPTFANSFPTSFQVNGEFTDVTLVSDDLIHFQAHKIVLSSCSSLFKTLLSSNSHSNPLIHLSGITQWQLSNILKFIYSGEVTLEHDNYDEIFRVLQNFALEELIQNSEHFLGYSLLCNDENFYIKQKNEEEVENNCTLPVNEKQCNKKPVQMFDNQKEGKNSLCAENSSIPEPSENHVEENKNLELEVRQENRDEGILETKNDKKENFMHCSFCDEKFSNYPPFSKHVQQNHSKHFEDFINTHKTTICNYCSKTFFTKSQKQDHILRVHKIKKKDQPKEIQLKIHCKICEKEFSSRRKSQLKKHMKKHEEFKSMAVAEKENTLCSLCGGNFVSMTALRMHDRKMHRQVNVQDRKLKSCPKCEEVLESGAEIRYHMFKKHNKGALFCDICGYKAPVKSRLKRHKRLKHGNNSALPCEHCGKIFKNDLYLTRHISVQHTKNTKHKCIICEKTFHDNSNLNNHMNVHTGLKPYKCLYCETQFQNKSNRLAHMKKLHSHKVG